MGAWELIAALGIGWIAGRRARHRLLASLAAATLAWTAIDLARGHFPVGSIGIETLATAVLVRVTSSELLAGLGSRALLVGSAWGALALLAGGVRLGARLRSRLRISAAVLLLAALACHEADRPAKTYFTPAEPAAASEIVRLTFDDPERRADAHPLLPPEARTSGTCLACHAAIAAPSDLPPARKGLHEIHAAIAGGEPGCVRCHPSAGARGFPGEYPELYFRREANQACAGCHSQAGAPFWPGVFR